jgi:hypothetical protein
MIYTEKDNRRQFIVQSRTIYDRIMALYEKYCPDNSSYLKKAHDELANARSNFNLALDRFNSGNVKYARAYADHFYNTSGLARSALYSYFKTIKVNKVLLEKHIWNFVKSCKDPYVDVKNDNTGARDDLCFTIGPYDLRYKGGVVRVGPFRMKVNLSYHFMWDGSDHDKGVRAYPASEWCYSHEGKIHPHQIARWGDNRICTGQAGKHIWVSIKAGRLMDVVRYAEAMMCTYTDDSTYTPILVFAQAKYKPKPPKPVAWTCAVCAFEGTNDDWSIMCACGCDTRLCEECSHYCDSCDQHYEERHICDSYECTNCGRYEAQCREERGRECYVCSNYNCDDCVTWCDCCERYYCGNHTQSCAGCTEIYCTECTEQHTDGLYYCPACLEEEVERQRQEQARQEAIDEAEAEIAAQAEEDGGDE